MGWEHIADTGWRQALYTFVLQLEPIVYGFLLLVCVVARWRSGSRPAVWLAFAAGLSLVAALVLRGRIVVSTLETPMVIHTLCRFGASFALLCGGMRLVREQRHAEAEALAEEPTVRLMSQRPPPIPPSPAELGLTILQLLAWILGAVGAGFLVVGAIAHERRTRARYDVFLGCAAACYGVGLFLTGMVRARSARLHRWLPVPYVVSDSMSELGALWPWLMLLAGLLALVGGGGLLAALLRPGPAEARRPG